MSEGNFVWSLERQAIFMRCPRAYYYLRFQAKQDDTTRQLSCLQKLEEWADNVIRRTLEQALLATGEAPLPKEAIKELAIGIMRKTWLEYLNGEWKQNPENATNIFQLYYGDGNDFGTSRRLPQEMTDNAKQHILEAVETFATSRFYQEICGTDRASWLFPGRKAIFSLGEISVQEAPDFIYKDKNGEYCSLFWTIGNEYRPFLRTRQACNMLYAIEKLNVSARQISVCTVFLNDGGRCRSFMVTDADLNTAKQQMQKGAEAMLARERASSEKEDFQMQPGDFCQDCNFRRLCLS